LAEWHTAGKGRDMSCCSCGLWQSAHIKSRSKVPWRGSAAACLPWGVSFVRSMLVEVLRGLMPSETLRHPFHGTPELPDSRDLRTMRHPRSPQVPVGLVAAPTPRGARKRPRSKARGYVPRSRPPRRRSQGVQQGLGTGKRMGDVQAARSCRSSSPACSRSGPPSQPAVTGPEQTDEDPSDPPQVPGNTLRMPRAYPAATRSYPVAVFC